MKGREEKGTMIDEKDSGERRRKKKAVGRGGRERVRKRRKTKMVKRVKWHGGEWKITTCSDNKQL